MQKIVMYFALASSLLAVGYNWRRVDEVVASETESHREFVRKDVITEQFNTINYKLTEIQKQLAMPPAVVGSSDTPNYSYPRRFDK